MTYENKNRKGVAAVIILTAVFCPGFWQMLPMKRD